MPNFVGVVDNTDRYANRNLLLKIQEEAEDSTFWETLRYDDSGEIHELIMKGEGYSATEEIFVGFRSYQNVGNDVYNISVAGFIGYVPGNSFVAQPGYFESGIPAHDEHIDVWLTINPQRIAFCLKVGTPVYESGYVGKFFPYDRPNIYPYPIVVGGMLDGIPETRFSETSHSMPYKGDRANFCMRFVDGAWLEVESEVWENNHLSATNERMAPLNGEYPLLPIVLCRPGDIFGELDGVFHISGFSNAVENTIPGEDCVVFQDVSRTGFSDYYALKLDD